MMFLSSCPTSPCPMPARLLLCFVAFLLAVFDVTVIFFFFFMVYLKAWGSLSALESPLQIPTLASINSAFRKEILKIEQKVINVRVLKVMDAVIVPSGERNNLCRLEGGTEGLLVAFAWGNCWWSCQSSYGKSEKMRLWITAPWHALVNRKEK